MRSYLSRWKFAVWPAVVIALMVFFVALNAFTPLRPLWNGVCASLSVATPAWDLRVVLTGIDAYREAGYRIDSDLLQKKSVENQVPVFNYPWVWFWFAYLPGVTTQNILVIAAVMYAAFGATLIRIFRDEEWPGLWLALATLASPSVVLLCERANSDLLIFCLIAWASLAIARSQRLATDIAAWAVFLVAAFLKLYPVASLAAVACAGGWRRWVLCACGVAIFATGTLAMRGDLRRVRRATPEPTDVAYGAKVIAYEALGRVEYERADAPQWRAFWNKLRSREDYFRWSGKLGVAAQILAAILCAGCAVFGLRSREHVTLAAALPAHLRTLFVSGAGVYCATFIANNNWAYRLAFLLLCIPALLRLARGGDALARLALGAIVIVCWLTPIFEPPEFFLLHNALHWALAAGLSYLIGAHLG